MPFHLNQEIEVVVSCSKCGQTLFSGDGVCRIRIKCSRCHTLNLATIHGDGTFTMAREPPEQLLKAANK